MPGTGRVADGSHRPARSAGRIRGDTDCVGVLTRLVSPFHFDPMAFSHVVGPVGPVHSSHPTEVYYEVRRQSIPVIDQAGRRRSVLAWPSQPQGGSP